MASPEAEPEESPKGEPEEEENREEHGEADLSSGVTDAQITRWSVEGNPALDRLVNRFESDVRQKIMRTCGRRKVPGQEWDDLVQTVWLGLCKLDPATVPSSPPGAFRAYLLTLAERRTLDIIREGRAAKRNPGSPVVFLDTEAARRAKPSPINNTPQTPSKYAIAGEKRERLRSRLNDREWAVFLGREKGMTQREIAEEVGLSERQVGRIAAKIRKIEDEMNSGTAE